MKILASLVLSLIFLTQASAQDLCAQKKKQYGKNFISCETVDWGAQPLSASYQPQNAGHMTALPHEVQNLKTGEFGYQGVAPGVSDTLRDRYGMDPKNMTLASRFASAMSLKEGNDSDIVKWLTTDWYNSLQPSASSAWEGKCENWAGWSMDPTLQKVFSQVRDGLMCNGVPFTRGELKEIVTALYPAPDFVDRKGLQAFYIGYKGQRSEQVEDANVALSKLGLLGSGDFKPEQVVKLASDAKAAGHALMMDKDAGNDIWNQPIKQVTDVAYDDQNVSEWEALSVSDFEPADQSGTFQQLSLIEKEFAVGLTQGLGIPESSSCVGKRLPSAICSGFDGLSLSAQVEKFNAMKKAAFTNKAVKIKGEMALVKHELIIEYGDESSFASMEADHTKTQTMTYIGIHSVNANGSVGAMIRSQWAPETRKMSEICKDMNFKGRVVSSLIVPIDQEQRCRDLKNGAVDSDVFVGALPPQTLKEFRTSPYFRNHQTQQAKAYYKFLDFMAGCQNFDQAAQFLRSLDRATQDNSISGDEIQNLKAAYPAVKDLIDRAWINEYVNQKQSMPGMPALKQQLLSL